MIRIAIVEDEKSYQEQLQEYLVQYGKESGNQFVVTCFGDGEDITEGYKAEYDIIFMDIQMQFMDGMTAAEKIREMDHEVIIMFITNMTQYAVKGYAVDALDYVLKPVNYFAFSQKLDRALDRLSNRVEQFISVPVSDGVLKLKISKILYVESQSHTLIFHVGGEEIASRGKMEDMESVLGTCGFFRSNKGYLVNLNCVDGVRDNCCLIDGQMLPISRRRKNEFLEALANYVSGVRK